VSRLFFGLVSLVALSGCANVIKPFSPVRPHIASGPGLEVEIVEAQLAGAFQSSIQFAIKAHGGRGVRLERGLLAPAAAPLCGEGVRDIGLFVDDELHWLRPVAIEGSHQLVLSFPQGAGLDLLEQRAVVDLVVYGARGKTCVRVPVSGNEPELAWQRSFDWSASLALRMAHPSSPVGGVEDRWSFDVGIGRWLGPVRLSAEVGSGDTDCRSDCPPARNGAEGFRLLPLRAAAEMYVIETEGFGLAAQGWYGLNFAWRTNGDGGRRNETSHGPGAALRLDLTRLWPAGWQSNVAQGALGLEFSLGHLQGTDNEDTALLWGWGIVSTVGF
jgi:hypothetical protein